MIEPIKFLLVDDVPENLVALEALLRRDGLEILKARSGAEALELLLVHEVALALLDVQMPEMDGFELAELMRGAEQTKHVPIIFVTAGAHDPRRVFKGYETGAVDFLFKPVDPHILKSKADIFFELYRQRRDLANALRLNEMFVGILGHDLRNPLGVMLTGSELLELDASDAQKRTLRRMHAAGQRMTDMIEQMLDLTRARLGGGLGFVRTRKHLDVCNLVQRCAEELRVVHPDREILVELSGDCTTSGDPQRLLQLFSNLVANAVVHGAAGAPVSVQVEGSASEIQVRICNQGHIPPELLPTLFDPFRGRKGVSPRSSGLGLGLFISQQIAIAHGGSVAVTSSEASGTRFVVTVPRRSAATRHATPGAPKKVLVVDDDEMIRASLCEALEEEGYTVASASNGQAALELLNEATSRPDVVILDLVMPIMDGARVYQAMQADDALAKIPVIVSTGNPARAPSGVITVPKPLNLHRLLDIVAEL
jgi:signal transduction histidine kinase